MDLNGTIALRAWAAKGSDPLEKCGEAEFFSQNSNLKTQNYKQRL